MKSETRKSASVDDYFKTAPPESIKALTQVRKTLKQHLPKHAVEVISYGIPAFKWHKTPLYYAGWKTHISIYPIPRGNAAFQKKIEPYKAGKGTLKFLLNEPLPLDFIATIVKTRVSYDGIEYTPIKTSQKKPSAKKVSTKKTTSVKTATKKPFTKSKPRSVKSK